MKSTNNMELKHTLKCSKCGDANDMATGVTFPGEEEVMSPGEGDISICSGCGHLMTFTKQSGKLMLREATPDELREAFADARVAAILRSRVLSGSTVKERLDRALKIH